MAAGRSWGGASRAGSNHPALPCTSSAPPYPRRGCLSRTYVAVFSSIWVYQERTQAPEVRASANP